MKDEEESNKPQPVARHTQGPSVTIIDLIAYIKKLPYAEGTCY